MVSSRLYRFQRGEAAVLCISDDLLTNAVQNVPPAWRALRYIWEWQDTWDIACISDEGIYEQDIPISESPAWWEDVSAALSAKEGRVNLS